MTFAIFLGASFLVLGGALGVLRLRNPVHAAMSLVVSLVGIAVFFLMQNAVLLAAVQIIVYASAIVVLFLFVIMLLGVDKVDPSNAEPGTRLPLAVGVSACILGGIFAATSKVWTTGTESLAGPIAKDGESNVSRVAEVIFTDYVWAFELTGILLTIAVVGAVVLARKEGASLITEGEASDVG